MNCERVAELLQSYFDGELEPGLSDQVAAAIEGCPHCQDELAFLVQMREAIREPILRELNEVSFQGMWERIDAQLVASPTAAEQPVTAAAAKPTHESPGLLERIGGLMSGLFARPAFAGAVGVCAVALVGYWVVGGSDSAQHQPQVGGGVQVATQGGSENSDALNNLAFVSSVTVSSGSVFIDQDPNDPEAPVIVWHIEDEVEPEQPSHQGG